MCIYVFYIHTNLYIYTYIYIMSIQGNLYIYVSMYTMYAYIYVLIILLIAIIYICTNIYIHIFIYICIICIFIGQLTYIYTDCIKNTFWIYGNEGIYEILVENEIRDIWRIYIHNKQFETALLYTKVCIYVYMYIYMCIYFIYFYIFPHFNT